MNVINTNKMKKQNITAINFNDLISTFANLTGWSSAFRGVNTADFAKSELVFTVDLADVFQNGQDWMTFVYVDDMVNKDKNLLVRHDEKTKYDAGYVYWLILDEIVSWMVVNGHLKVSNKEGKVLVIG